MTLSRNKLRDLLASSLLSLVILAMLLMAWHVATLPAPEPTGVAAGSGDTGNSTQDEYARLMGQGAKKTDGFPSPAQVGQTREPDSGKL